MYMADGHHFSRDRRDHGDRSCGCNSCVPENHVVGPDTFNRLFTMHGTTMVFLVGMPIIAGMSNYLDTADDRRARHGVSAAECFRLLDFSVRRHSCSISATSARTDCSARARRPMSDGLHTRR